MFKADDLIRKYRKEKSKVQAKKLIFTGVEGYDVYNISAPFMLNHQLVLAGRIEQRDSEHSHVGLFTLNDKQEWELLDNGIFLELQDPFVTIIDQQVILGGVEVNFEGEKVLGWRTVFYNLKNIGKADFVFAGPWGMKDLRLKQLNDGRILILTRPQGDKGGLGKIGCTVIDNVSELSIETIEAAPLLENQFIDEEWGGANEIHIVNGKICVLGHIGSKDKEKNLHYRALAFEINEEHTKICNPRIIAERADFLEGATKRPDLVDVVFSGGLILDGPQAVLYAGTSDAEAQSLTLPNPFNE
ncbi:DUF1861 family protein [Lactococcus garvieae]|uniref:DUF1861 family protein n=1 Tax=Lactococcus garvieae TaxID=1363 RepID=UPI00254B1907|nr:DUF1861 family protein [Lactococcus garvieae]